MRTRLYLGCIGLSAGIVLLGQAERAGAGFGSASGSGPDRSGAAGPAAADGHGALPDVLLSGVATLRNWGEVDGIHGYSIGSHTCNIGEGDLLWGRDNLGTPTLGMNAYRFENGRLMQIGMSFAKHSTRAVALDGCGQKCNGVDESFLGAGCLDVYTADINGIQTRLGPRSQVNAWTGELGPFEVAVGDATFRRIQVAEADLDPAHHPDALYFVEGVFVALDDAGVQGNGMNNASHKRVVVDAEDYDLLPRGLTQQGLPAIYAWRDHGLGLNTPDPSVMVQPVDVPGEGRFHVASKAVDLGDGTWRYEYAAFNLNSDRSAARLTVTTGVGVNVTDVGFHDVDYHSDEIYDNTDWTIQIDPAQVAWRSPADFADDPNTNALRWGMMYNFWFTADAPPKETPAWFNMFKPGGPERVSFPVVGPAACGADLDDDGQVGFTDLLRLLAVWGPCIDCPEDLDDNGSVDFVDLITLLAEWGPCI